MRFSLIFLIFLFLAPLSFADTLWQDREHPPVKYAALDAGASYLYYRPNGYTGMKRGGQNLAVYTAELYASGGVPVFSRIRWMSTAEVDFNRPRFTEGSRDAMVYSFLLELKTPFTVSFFGYGTPIYVQYGRSSNSFSSRTSQDINYKGSLIVPIGTEATLSDLTQYAAVALGTPITNDDAVYSYSRVGVYYSQTERARSATLPDSDESWLFDVVEWNGGLFYDLSKPVWVNGLILGIYLGGGIGVRELGANAAGVTDGNFEGSKLNLFLSFDGSVSYRVDFTDHLSLRLRAAYSYGSLTTLQRSSSDSGEYDNTESSRFIAGGILNLTF